MPYRAPVDDFTFLFDHVVGLDQVRATERFEEASSDVTAAILTEAGKMCEEVMAPLQRNGDLTPAHLENGVVRTSPALPKGSRRLPMAAGSGSPRTPSMAAWDCRWR